MFRSVGGIIALLLALPAWGYQDKSKEKPTTPEQQYQALLKEENDAMNAFQEAYQKAKTSKERNKIIAEKYPRPEKAVPKFLELAEKYPQSPVAVDALTEVVTRARQGGKDSPRAKALAILQRNHVQSNKMGRICQSLANSYGKEETDLLRSILAKNPSKEVQAEACLALGQQLGQRAKLVRLLKSRAELMKQVEQVFGKELTEELQKADATKIDAESAHYFEEFAEKYAVQMKPDRIDQLCQGLGRLGVSGSEALLRAFMGKDSRREVQGFACLALAKSLKNRADDMSESKEAEKLRQESEQLFERAITKYADVKLSFGGTVADQAKGALYELRYLSIGKVAPEVEGEDADSKKFKLSDYRGKVVLLDFWGNW